MRKIVEFIFYGNYFYGLCAVALLLETTIQLDLGVDEPLVYLIAFLTTLLFYNYPYTRIRNTGHLDTTGLTSGESPRVTWYLKNRKAVRFSNLSAGVILIMAVFKLLLTYPELFTNSTPLVYLILLVFPIAGLLYYGITISRVKLNLRQIGWFKPFLIGFVWAGMTYVYPICFVWLTGHKPVQFEFLHYMLFAKSVMYIAMLAILFDIKDYVSDQKNQLGTFIVKFGMKNTMVYIIIPLTLVGIMMFASYALIHQFSPGKIALTMIPFILLIASTLSFRKKRSLLFYLIIIDGLMIIKAFFSSIAMYI